MDAHSPFHNFMQSVKASNEAELLFLATSGAL